MASPATCPGDIVRDVIAEVAPAELPIVDGLRQLGPRAARRRLRGRRRSRDPVAFGLDQVAALMTPVAWIVIDEVTRRVTDDAAGSLGSRITHALRAAIRWLTRRPPAVETNAGGAAAQPMPLTQGQLAAVRGRIVELAPSYNLTADQAEILGDQMVARLALAGTAATSTGPGSGSADENARDPGTSAPGSAR